MVVSATHSTECGNRYIMMGNRTNICIDIDAEGGHSSSHVPTNDPDPWIQRDSEDSGCQSDRGGSGLVVIAATNRLEDIDPAVVRRFESRVYVGVPEHDTRVAMLINFLR